jgi:Ca2+-binding RTX toxin-like protein
MANLNGTAGNDTLFGTGGDDLVIAMDGDDLLNSGSGGSDTLDGGNGNDTATYTAYNSARYAKAPSEGINANLQTGVVQLSNRLRNGKLSNIENLIGTKLNDILVGNIGNNMLSGYAGNDFIDAGSGNDTLHGDSGSDRVIGGAGDDELNGGSGDDTLDGSSGYDTLNGGDGNDTADYSLSSESVYVNLQANQAVFSTTNNRFMPITAIENVIGGSSNAYNWLIGNAENNRLTGGRGNDTLVGNDGDDTLIGNDGNDSLFGGAGNDWLNGGFGVDHLNGGDGIDTATYAFSTEGISADLETGVVRLPGQANETALSIENLIGSSGHDTVSGNSANNWISGGAGDDWLVGRGGNNTLEGGEGNDYLFGGSEASNAFDGRPDGNNVVFGGLGDDVIYGGSGDDTLEGGGGNDTLYGGGGFDTARIVADVHDMTITSNAYSNYVHQSDYVRQDVYQRLETDQVNGIHRINLVGGESGNAMMARQASVSVILEGMGGDDFLEGGRDHDTLYGGAGNDTLNGSQGTNQLYGGTGKDTFVMGPSNSMQVIHDFKRTEDRLDVQNSKLSDLRVVYEGKDSVIHKKTTVYKTVGGRQVASIVEMPQVRVKDAYVDSRDFVGVQGGTMQHLPLTYDTQIDVGNLVRAWGRSYAAFKKNLTFQEVPYNSNGNDPLLSTLGFTVGDMTVSNLKLGELENVIVQEAKVKTTFGGSAVFTYGGTKEYGTETSRSDAHTFGLSIERTFEGNVGLAGVAEITSGINMTASYNFTRTTGSSTSTTKGSEYQDTIYLNAPATSVMMARGGATQRKATADFTTDFTINGDVRLKFTDQYKNTTSVDVPIGAILQTYMPGVFRGEGSVEQKTLADGVHLVYNANTVFTQTGFVNLSGYQSVYAEDYIVQDDDLATDTTLGMHKGEDHAENFWVVMGESLPNRGKDVLTGEPIVLQISKFNDQGGKFDDKIGIFLGKAQDENSRINYNSLTISDVEVLVKLDNHSGESSNAKQPATRISLGSTALVDVIGISKDQLGESDFIFSKKGTFYDNTLSLFTGGTPDMPNKLPGQPV